MDKAQLNACFEDADLSNDDKRRAVDDAQRVASLEIACLERSLNEMVREHSPSLEDAPWWLVETLMVGIEFAENRTDRYARIMRQLIVTALKLLSQFQLSGRTFRSIDELLATLFRELRAHVDERVRLAQQVMRNQEVNDDSKETAN